MVLSEAPGAIVAQDEQDLWAEMKDFTSLI